LKLQKWNSLRTSVLRNVETRNPKLDTLTGPFLCYAEFYDCSEPHVLDDFAFGYLKESFILILQIQ
jgi:hypothetical protein